ncbi:unnamed protein product [Amoebophrya sp. A25]|nr:unnamed protein product [Amoebophrya sp. A25]|eukprot:GSA25T00025835001.1
MSESGNPYDENPYGGSSEGNPYAGGSQDNPYGQEKGQAAGEEQQNENAASEAQQEADGPSEQQAAGSEPQAAAAPQQGPSQVESVDANPYADVGSLQGIGESINPYADVGSIPESPANPYQQRNNNNLGADNVDRGDVFTPGVPNAAAAFPAVGRSAASSSSAANPYADRGSNPLSNPYAGIQNDLYAGGGGSDAGGINRAGGGSAGGGVNGVEQGRGPQLPDSGRGLGPNSLEQEQADSFRSDSLKRSSNEQPPGEDGAAGEDGEGQKEEDRSNESGVGGADGAEEEVQMTTDEVFRPAEEHGDADAAMAADAENVQKFKRMWTNEKYSPEILQCDEELLKAVCEVLDVQSEMIKQDFQVQADDELGYNAEIVPDQVQVLKKVQEEIMLVDTQHLRYMIKDYMRMRLTKIEAFALYYSTDAKAKAVLTSTEKRMAEKLWELEKDELTSRCVRSLPAHKDMQTLDKESITEDMDMMPKPKLLQPVFCEVLKECMIRFREPGVPTPNSGGVLEPG